MLTTPERELRGVNLGLKRMFRGVLTKSGCNVKDHWEFLYARRRDLITPFLEETRGIVPWSFVPIKTARGCLDVAILWDYYLSTGIPFNTIPADDYITTLMNQSGLNDQELFQYSAMFSMYGAWRLAKDYYVFDRNLLESLLNTKNMDEIPDDLLRNFPSWAGYVYMENTSITINDTDYNGVMLYPAASTFSPDKDCMYYVFYSDMHNKKFFGRFNFGKGSFSSALEGEKELFIDRAAEANRDITGQIEMSYEVAQDLMGTKHNDLLELSYKVAAEVVFKIALYLCSSKPDIKGDTKAIAFKRNALAKGVFKPREKINIIQVGREVAKRIMASQTSGGTGSPKSPHLRRGHWHGYWVGKIGSEARKFKYNWIPPTFVNCEGL
jgi:hypothetical protein